MCGVRCAVCVAEQKRSEKMTKAITLIDCLKKVQTVLNLSNASSMVLTLPTFKRVMMLYPEEGPVIASERAVKEKYRTMKEVGIINNDGRLDMDLFLKWAVA